MVAFMINNHTPVHLFWQAKCTMSRAHAAYTKTHVHENAPGWLAPSDPYTSKNSTLDNLGLVLFFGFFPQLSN